MGSRAASTNIHYLILYAIMFIECLFLHIYSSCGQLLSPCLASSLSCVILSQVDLLEVPVTYLGSFGCFLLRGPVLLNSCSSEKLILTGGSRVYSLLSLILYPKRVHFVSLTLSQLSTGDPDGTCC
jgi:hypothetical protein